MVFVKRRLFFWLLKAYFKKWGKTFLLFFFAGLAVFFLVRSFLPTISQKIPIGQSKAIGLVGPYNLDSLPDDVSSLVSRGLTTQSLDNQPKPDVAGSWKIENKDKTYTFFLKHTISFSDGSHLTSDSISYQFADVTVSKPNKYEISFTLKDSYSPFLVTVSRPIYKKGLIGLGNYKIKEAIVNGNFLESLTIVSTKNSLDIKKYYFYPSQDALKLAFMLGELSQADHLSNDSFKNQSFTDFPNTRVDKTIDYTKLVTLFYNTKDPILSDEKMRNALSYAIPDSFVEGKRNNSPFSPQSWAYPLGLEDKKQDLVHAGILRNASLASQSANVTLSIKTLPAYKTTAEELAKIWKQIRIDTKIEEVQSVPDSFQIFLGDFILPKDPDQYTIWHSDQKNNITQYDRTQRNSQRIDKLLEDGRKTTDLAERKKIYSDFQKYLLADSPASFLYFPYEYTITRK